MPRFLPKPRLREKLRLSASDRALIAKLARAAKGGIITVPDAATALGTSRRTAALKLAALARRDWLIRARRGMYLVLPLEAEPGQPTIAEDAWLLAHEAFSPCYIGGWSAAEHWGLTEQIFRKTLVVTAAHIRRRSENILGHDFLLFRAPASRTAGSGITSVWRGSDRAPVSTPERTIADCLRHPELCAGIRNLADFMREYGSRKDRRLDELLSEVASIGTGAAWKRLGYLSEQLWADAPEVAAEARNHLTSGYTYLDPSIRRRGKLLTKWKLWINVHLPPTIELSRDDSQAGDH